jgi:hypothetical protein
MSYPADPHFRFPFQRGSVVEQDTVDHVMSCEMVIVSYPIGLRQDRPEFGWPWPELDTPPLDLGPLQQAMKQFEPRATTTASQYPDLVQLAMQHISVNVAIQSSDTDPGPTENAPGT